MQHEISLLTKSINNLAVKVDNIRDDLNKTNAKLDKFMIDTNNRLSILEVSIDNVTMTINTHIKTIATKLESGLGHEFIRHFLPNIQNTYFQKIDSFKFFDCYDNKITDIDYAAFVKDGVLDKEYNIDIDKTKKSKDYLFFVIIEAKNKITKNKVIEKIYQLYKIKTIIKNLKTIDLSQCRREFVSMVENFKKQYHIGLDEIDTDKLLFYVGGDIWGDNKAEEFIKKIQKSDDDVIRILSKQCIAQLKKTDISEDAFYEMLKFLQHRIGYIKLEGNEHKFYDNYGVHGVSSIGGKNSSNKRILKNKI